MPLRPKAPRPSASVTKNGTTLTLRAGYGPDYPDRASDHANRAADPTLTGGALSFGLKPNIPGQQFHSPAAYGRTESGRTESSRTKRARMEAGRTEKGRMERARIEGAHTEGGCTKEGRKEGDRTQLRRSPAFRCFRPPLEAEVILSRSLPVYVTASPGHGAAEEVQGPVGTRAGPWKVCGEWWTPNGWQYEEWDVEIKGRLYRICCELPSMNWYVTGVYD